MSNPDLFFLDQQTHNAPFALVEKHLGSIHDFCVPVNPYFPTKEMLRLYADNLEEILTYYPEDGAHLSDFVSKEIGIPSEHIVLGNGSTELITAIDHLFIPQNLLTCVPTFGRWTDQSAESGKEVIPFLRREEEGFQLNIERLKETIKRTKTRCVAISNPNNPTGSISSPSDFKEICSLDLDLLIIDESFIEFATLDRRFSSIRLALEAPNVLVLRSLGKSLGAHGVRLGYAVGSKENITKLARFLPRWNINSLAVALLKGFSQNKGAYELSRARVIRDRAYLLSSLSKISGLRVFNSYANFLYVKLPEGISGKVFRNRLITEYGCFVRECGNKIGSSSQFLRIAVNPREATDLLCRGIEKILSHQS